MKIIFQSLGKWEWGYNDQLKKCPTIQDAQEEIDGCVQQVLFCTLCRKWDSCGNNGSGSHVFIPERTR